MDKDSLGGCQETEQSREGRGSTIIPLAAGQVEAGRLQHRNTTKSQLFPSWEAEVGQLARFLKKRLLEIAGAANR